MTMRIDRASLLATLQLCEPGTSSREVIEQSACVVFRKGEVLTFNDEISCRAVGYAHLLGAVRLTPLRNILEKLIEKTLIVEQTDTHLVFKGKRRQLGVVCEKQIMLPLKHLEKPTEWRKLSAGFIEGIKSVQVCAGHDDAKFVLTCIHLHPQYVESFDDYKYARCQVKTGIQSSVLVRQSSIRHIEKMGAEEVSESERWLHFRNASGFILSCRKYTDEYPNMDKVAASTGQKVTLPIKLVDAAKCAEVFSVDSEDNLVEVALQPTRAVLTGTGNFGWYSEVRELKPAYKGPNFRFKISPQMLEELLTKYRECQISDNALIAGDDKFRYVTSVLTLNTTNGEAAVSPKKKVRKERVA